MDKNQEKIIQTDVKVVKVKKEKRSFFGIKSDIIVVYIGLALLVAGTLSGAIYWRASANKISIDNSTISAPVIDLSPKTSGILEEVFVNEGDQVTANAILVRVGNELIKAKNPGLIIGVKDGIGQMFSAGTPVVSMIDPMELRVVGQIEENKGLADIKVGQPAIFTVDAFGSQESSGVVDEITPTSNDSAVLFSISDKREVKKFDIKIRFNTAEHPEFKNGMSAKIVIYKN
jgi:multidrug resistance efflux pump